MKKSIRYRLEYVLLFLLCWFFRLMPWKMASNIGGFIGRSVGPRLAASRKAMRHIRAALPHKTEAEAAQIVIGMWDNLGRVMAEYPHLERIAKTIHQTIEGKHAEKLAAMHTRQTPIMFLSAHIGNWELAPAFLLCHGITAHSIYRRPNNPYTAKLLEDYRSFGGRISLFPKSKRGSILVVKALQANENIAMLIDQKYNEGIDSLFFGMTARTSTMFIDLARRYDCPVIPGRIIRKNGTDFDIELCDPIPLNDVQGNERTHEDIVADYHRLLEGWIEQHPEQWLWLHRRWRDL